ncbi:uncharacterized protein LOC105189399 [Harpegnathos saltator]|uniref:Myb/SANT-like DNA-binding domain-containing protein n=1 Tax=Harpegnathos saltator TaxID=610380 RepID=E2C318_HARSA|nr:uncharacterized protein LOC105189399 [Harpegnathos saltator]XP_025162539.1 uncharacterized protein LOC105189399 [Harpegnathos saltator]XP_025162540.1 uncharacterized protein LOC105189399 [Harpegnathos saltator]XP_025162541.1 uncharacterized protein LOC105189399 [Harpegnathos saltator]EFN77662.1 hypothetical protein EAI_00178 [Harpegnathos saltator]
MENYAGRRTQEIQPMADNNSNNRIYWDEDMTKLLLQEISVCINSFGHQVYKTVWKSIANDINIKAYNVSADHCNNKWRSLKKRYKSIKDNNKQSGADRQYWIHYDAIDDILKKHPEITPLSVASSTNGFRITGNLDIDEDNENNCEEIPSCSNRTNRLGKIRKHKNMNEPYCAQLRL